MIKVFDGNRLVLPDFRQMGTKKEDTLRCPH